MSLETLLAFSPRKRYYGFAVLNDWKRDARPCSVPLPECFSGASSRNSGALHFQPEILKNEPSKIFPSVRISRLPDGVYLRHLKRLLR